MKNFTSFILFLLLFPLSDAASQTDNKKVSPDGAWKFEAPYAPEGFNAGIITIGQKEKLYTAAISFSASDYKIQGEKVKFENGILQFDIYVEGETVSIILNMPDNSNLTGKALYSAGEIPLSAKRADSKK
jgi:hypothetical protein